MVKERLLQSFLSKVDPNPSIHTSLSNHGSKSSKYLHDVKARLTLCLVWLTVGLHRILSLLESEDIDVRVHAVKVVANLAAEGWIGRIHNIRP